jgi:hypothetical protein
MVMMMLWFKPVNAAARMPRIVVGAVAMMMSMTTTKKGGVCGFFFRLWYPYTKIMHTSVKSERDIQERYIFTSSTNQRR